MQVQQKEQLEQRILLQENEISNMENRNYFSLLCVQLETQLIHANLEGLYIALHIMATVEARTHSEVCKNCKKNASSLILAQLCLFCSLQSSGKTSNQ